MALTLVPQANKPSKAPKAKITTREQWLNEFTRACRPKFMEAGYPLPNEVRCSIGHPSKGIRSKVIGECWSSAASADGHVEIFIRPSLQSDTSRIADVLTHELIHAALGTEEGHGKTFGKVARFLGLEGKLTATTAGEQWHLWADPILAKLGPLPGAALAAGAELAGGKKKQTTRMIKLSCDQCEFTCRTSAKHIHDVMICPTGCGGNLSTDQGDAE